MANLKLSIVSQEKQLVDTTATQVTAPASEGEVTVLPYHAPLFTRLDEGVIHYNSVDGEHSLVISKGFLSVSPENEVTVMVDAGVMERDISIEKAQEAMDQAKATIHDKTATQRELMHAEAAMRKAMWEIKLAQKSGKSRP